MAAAKWDENTMAIACKTQAEVELVRLAHNYFLAPGDKALAHLKHRLSEQTGDAMRKALLLIQAANAGLDCEYIQVAALIAEQGGTIACTPGCSACCSHMLVCTPFEAALIGLYLVEQPKAHQHFLKEYRAWNTATAGLRASYLAWGTQYYSQGVDSGAHRVQDYSVPCPFLANDYCCIYAVRPYACRSCVSVSEQCQKPVNPQEKPGMHSIELGAHTPHKKARQTVNTLLWEISGFDPAKTTTGIMPELVGLWLESGNNALLEACLVRKA